MDNTTKMLVGMIKKNGYWRKGTTLGEGGWPEVYSFASNWKKYILLDGGGETIDEITAQDDGTAVKAFKGLYFIHEIPGYEIVEKITEFRTVKEG